MMTINVNKIEVKHLFEKATDVEGESQIYELENDEQVFSPNEVAKFEIARELRHQGVTIEAISRMLSIHKEELIAEFDLCE